ncbi:DUF4178 domain-containing protein [Stigmatella aurantiaca]|uniref:Conserved uncharacterized protein n=1 Tax=Stigmatella aurantiaca (strain DW4/3-1) TaxID=378806 RepID=Q09CE6_STIAD|nr:DUF4178 domain-containing protein [Stigmatella aurantiaca]ADO69597.1 conserved uncharacterized protein [Stigmatella aurantiaca DW4/3-1]EAU69400.1 conserved hypothetical protein [Stigmatella aurantiaca DW4/3-1]
MTQGQCPSCGAPVEFTAGSAQVLVCGYCQTVVAKKGLHLEAHGKIGAIVDTDSPLRLGLEGRHDRAPYRLVGHLQKDHGAGPWDEWYVEFENGRTAWLSEAEGFFYLLFESGVEEGLALDSLHPGERFSLRNRSYVVEERGHGRVVAAEGQLPSDVDPSEDSYYVDATGPKGTLITLDFGTRSRDPEIFVGQRLKLEQLGIPMDQVRPKARKVALDQARCPQCNGALALRAPDSTRRVACPYCGALLDASKGRLAFLQLLEKPDHPPLIPLGAKGRLDGVEWICIGFMVRSCTVEGVRYPWEEYLLFNRARGFTWLMQSNGHWVYLKPLDAGEVSLAPGSSAYHEGRRYKSFQSVTAVTETVLGEFYWEVRAGETAEASEYVAPPYSVNVDATESEVSYTLGEYLAPSVIQEAFQLKEPLPSLQGIAPSQPNPHSSASTWKWASFWAAALVAVYMVVNLLAANALVLDMTVRLDADAVSGQPSAMHFSEPFTIHKRGNVRAEVFAEVSNNWIGVQGDLVNQETGEVTSFYEELSYYSGRDSDGDWTEGSREATEYLSAVEPGTYVLRTTAAFSSGTGPQGRAFKVKLTSDVPRGTWFCLAVVVLLLGPVFSYLRSSSFESARWAESN